jgi:hypothetical protein
VDHDDTEARIREHVADVHSRLVDASHAIRARPELAHQEHDVIGTIGMGAGGAAAAAAMTAVDLWCDDGLRRRVREEFDAAGDEPQLLV